MKLNEKLIKLRKEKGLSQEEFGNEINVSRQAISKWENQESKPDIEKLQEIGKKFNISYDYLLNDEIETTEQISISSKKSKKKILLRIFLIIIAIYLVFCIYKGIAFTKFYLIANSFSEENYWMNQDFKNYNVFDGVTEFVSDYQKVGNKIVHKNFPIIEKDITEQVNAYDKPSYIDYKDYDEKINYTLNYFADEDKYVYTDNTELATQEELNDMFDIKNANLKEVTLSQIPSNFKEIFLASINPLYYKVSLVNRSFSALYTDGVNLGKYVLTLTKDCLVENITLKVSDNYYTSINYSYDYVQDHFSNIVNPLDELKDMIEYE